MAANKFKRDGLDVMKNGKFYAKAANDIAAITIVDALYRAEGRTPPEVKQ